MKYVLLILMYFCSTFQPKAYTDTFFYTKRKQIPLVVKVTTPTKKVILTPLMKYIRKHEGLVLKPYYCPAGQLSIGYGHKILPHEKYDSITVSQADSLLSSDVNKTKRWVRANTTLQGNKLEAITHFCYALGVGNFQKSNLYKLVQAGEPIDHEIIKWCHIGKKFNQALLDMRYYELNLYNNDIRVQQERQDNCNR
jgi:lysozyme